MLYFGTLKFCVMKRVLLIFLTCPTFLFAQASDAICNTVASLSYIIQKNHFLPKPIDDSLSVFVFDNLIDHLDSGRNLFSKQDYELLSKNRFLVDDFINNENCIFIDELTILYKNALVRKKQILLKLEASNFDYNTNDSIRFSKQKFDFDVDNSAFEKVWNKKLRYSILEEIAKISTNEDSLKMNFIALEKEIKQKIINTKLCKINSFLDKEEEISAKIKTDFLNSFCTYFDPHSNYFSSDARSSFMSGLSASNLSLGIEVSLNDEEEIIIEEIIPGGPASGNSNIDVGDSIIKIGNTLGLEYWVSCSSLENIGNLIFSDANKIINLTLQKKSGISVAVSLHKKVLRSTSNKVFSFIIEKNSKAGYIKIPNFYSDFENNTSSGCANDVAKEIIKLKSDGIDGLIIDLQNNGGGSMEEAIKLVGMFINIGPISILVDRNKRQNTLKDYNRGVVYDGPIIILMNGYSASASEFFAAALQDYNRALVVGSTSLGKASMQAILPLDESSDKEFLKLTIEKFYRITGDSHQLKGIVPDIFMPTLFDSIIKRESSFASAIAYDTIPTIARFSINPNFFSDELKNLSRKRIENDLHLKEINRINNQINKLHNMDKSPIRINFADVFVSIHETDALWQIIKQMNLEETDCLIKNNGYDRVKYGLDENAMNINSSKIKNVQKNPYVAEALNIINDYRQTKL